MNDRKHLHLLLGEGNLLISNILNEFSRNGLKGSSGIGEFVTDYSTDFYYEKSVNFAKEIESITSA